ncbi:hypothetical protein YC2023_112357 [Brassica napus]
MVSLFSSRKRSRKERKNPYSDLGLEKFSALLSELDEKRQSIYATRVDSDGPPLVRFVFKSSGECVPIMIKTKKVTKKKDSQYDLKVKIETKVEEENETKKTELVTEQKQSCVLNENLKKISRPKHFLPVTTILVLIFFVFFGRTVSIMCTCIVWYLVPLIKEHCRRRGSSQHETEKKNKKKFPHLAAPEKEYKVANREKQSCVLNENLKKTRDNDLGIDLLGVLWMNRVDSVHLYHSLHCSIDQRTLQKEKIIIIQDRKEKHI